MKGERLPEEAFVDSYELDKPREKCGVFGAFTGSGQAYNDIFVGLDQLQHRGDQGAGIAVTNFNQKIDVNRDFGEVASVFDKYNLLSLSENPIGIGHVLYATAGNKPSRESLQPLDREVNGYSFALAHNGNLIRMQDRELNNLDSESDTSTFANCLAEHIEQYGGSVKDALRAILPVTEGAFSFVVMDNESLMGIRDPHGFRPLVIGRRGNEYFFSSETGALEMVGAEFVDNVNPGEVVAIDINGISRERFAPEMPGAFCINEMVYFSRQDAIQPDGESTGKKRMRLGEQLAAEFYVDVDIVAGVPGTGVAIANGYANASGIPIAEAIVKKGARRSFQQNQQLLRQKEAKRKLHIVSDLVEGQRLIVIDDSLIRGTSTKELVGKLFKHGAKEVHLLIASPPHLYGCHMGMDTGREDNLIARHHSIEDIRQIVGANSLHFLSLTGLKKANGGENGHCFACFNGNYPVPVKIGALATRN